MAKSRGSFKKRKKEFARKEKKAQKRQRKLARKAVKLEENSKQSQNEIANLLA